MVSVGINPACDLENCLCSAVITHTVKKDAGGKGGGGNGGGRRSGFDLKYCVKIPPVGSRKESSAHHSPAHRCDAGDASPHEAFHHERHLLQTSVVAALNIKLLLKSDQEDVSHHYSHAFSPAVRLVLPSPKDRRSRTSHTNIIRLGTSEPPRSAGGKLQWKRPSKGNQTADTI